MRKHITTTTLLRISFILAIAGGICVYIYFSNVTNSRIASHFATVITPNICELVTKRLTLFSSDIHLDQYLPAEPKSVDKGNGVYECNFFVHGVLQDRSLYNAFVHATVSKTQTKQKSNVNSDATLNSSDPYNVFIYTGQLDYYNVEVTAGIDPIHSTFTPELNDSMAKLLTVLVGSGITDGLPVNHNVDTN